jgi:hypothetical protein
MAVFFLFIAEFAQSKKACAILIQFMLDAGVSHKQN